MEENKGITQGLAWTFAERITAQLVTAIVTIVLARLLAPEQLGIISIVTVIISFMNVFVTSGFGSSLVQQKNILDIDYNTAFFLSLSLSVLFYTISFFAAGLVAQFYDEPILKPVIRVMSIRVILASFNTVQQASIRRQMAFKKFFWSTLIGTVASGVVGVLLAYKEFGVWAVVVQYLTNSIIDTSILFCVSKWKPKLQFSWSSAKKIWSFGWKVLCSQLISTIEADVRSLAIGKVFSSSDLAYYDQGKKFPSLLISNANVAIQKVLLPAYSKKQDSKETLKSLLRKTVQIGIYILAPLLIGLFFVADTFVCAVLTEKWINCIPYVKIFCFVYLTRPIETACNQAILAIGRSDISLASIIIIDGSGFLLMLYAIFIMKSVLWVALFALLSTFVSINVFLFFARRLLSYNIKEQVRDILPPLIMSCFMAIIVISERYLPLTEELILCVQIVSGAIVYLGLSVITKNKSFYYLVSQINRAKEVIKR